MDIFNNDDEEGGERIPHGMPILDNVCFLFQIDGIIGD